MSVHTRKHKIQINNVLFEIFIANALPTVKDPSLISSLHTHAYTEIFACKKDGAFLKISDQTFLLHADDMVIVPSKIAHMLIPNMISKTEFVSVGIVYSKHSSKSDTDLYSSLSLLTGDKILICKNNHSLYRIIKNMYSDEKESLSVFIEFLSKLIETLNDNKSVQATSITTEEHIPKNIDILLQLDHIINLEFMDPLTQEIIAKKLNISQRQLSRIVSKCYNTTVHTLLTKKRLSAATKLLIETSNNIEEISSSVGFNSKHIFYREFNKFYGTTPARYRKAHKGSNLK